MFSRIDRVGSMADFSQPSYGFCKVRGYSYNRASNTSRTKSDSVPLPSFHGSLPLLTMFCLSFCNINIFSIHVCSISIKRKNVPPMRSVHSPLSWVVPATGVTVAPPDRLDGLRYPILVFDQGFFFSLPSRYALIRTRAGGTGVQAEPT